MFIFISCLFCKLLDQLMRESEQHRFENMRSLLDDKARELITFQKQLRQQITRLVSGNYFCSTYVSLSKRID